MLEQSLDIMYWALHQSETHHALLEDEAFSTLLKQLTQQNDTDFKRAIDCYKYPSQYVAEQVADAKSNAAVILKEWNALLNKDVYFYGREASFIDYALMPFVRQFAGVDKTYFAGLAIPHVQEWLAKISESELFVEIMHKS